MSPILQRSLALLAIFLFNCADSKTAEPASSLLMLHNYYLKQPPHSTHLYDILQVSSNATQPAIQKSYRKLSRLLHPDKQQQQFNCTTDDDTVNALERVRHAYDVLKDDQSRLIYHKYGLDDIQQAVILLQGDVAHAKSEWLSLLRLMGYSSCDTTTTTTDRVEYMASQLVELLRPVVEGRITEATLADIFAIDCDYWKGLPLGAQIVRCIGRAYRYEGLKCLRNSRSGAIRESVRLKFRSAKHMVNAVFATGRVVLAERETKRMRTRHQKLLIDSNNNDNPLDDTFDELELTNEFVRERERQKTRQVLLESLQVEALWKVRKIELDRVVRDACKLVLQGHYFFYPSHQSMHPTDWRRQGGDGWVGSTGTAIDAHVGQLRAAKALLLLGNVMVQRTKERTAWME
jgi:curved DNA-binding protein CbpA